MADTHVTAAQPEAVAKAIAQGVRSPDGRVGRLPFAAANVLVGAGGWRYVRCGFHGYEVEPVPFGCQR